MLRSALVILVLVSILPTISRAGAAAPPSPSATPGLPFTEDFASTALRDAARTTADWATTVPSLQLPGRSPRFGVLGAGGATLVGSDITTDNHYTRAIALGDIDGDGDLDLVCGNTGDISRYYLNNGTSDPWAGVTGIDIVSPDTYENTNSVALGDVDGDGDLDFVAGNQDSVRRLYLNNGTSSPFAGADGRAITNDAGMVYGIALGDVDRDGDLDLVCVYGSGGASNVNKLYLNNGTLNPWSGAVGVAITGDNQDSRSCALGDVDADGDLDLVVGNATSTTKLYLNDGVGSPWDTAVGTNVTGDISVVYGISLADVDGDGDLDVVAANNNSIPKIYLNDGVGAPFDTATGIVLPGSSFYGTGVATGDLDADGDIDAVFSNSNGTCRLFRNNHSSSPFASVAAEAITAETESSFAILLADVDRDGDLDVVVGKNGRNRYYRNDGSAGPYGAVVGKDVSTESQKSRAIAVGDVDGDGDPDLVVGNYSEVNRLYLNNGTADPWAGVVAKSITADIYKTQAVALADVDRDGDLDFLTGNDAQAIRLYLNNGTADPWNGVVGVNLTADANVTSSLAVGDVDRDGDPDVVAGNGVSTGQVNRLYRNDGTGTVWTGSNITADAARTYAVALGDLDGDGDLDLVAGNAATQSRWYPNDGTGDPWDTASGQNVTADTPSAWSIGLGDLDRDGDLDVAFGVYTGVSRVYLNNGTAAPFSGVTPSDLTSDFAFTRALALADVDVDGDLDAVLGNYVNVNRMYPNNGTAAPFSGVVGSDVTTDTLDTMALAVCDVNSDGAVDVVTGNGWNSPNLNRYYLGAAPSNRWSVAASGTVTSDALATAALAIADLDTDGDADVVTAENGVASRVYLNNGTTAPWSGVTGVPYNTSDFGSVSVAVGDLDRDGDPDLVTGNAASVCRYPNDGDATPFVPAQACTALGLAADHQNAVVAIGDVNRDGWPDVVVGNGGTKTNILYLADGSGGFAAKQNITADTNDTRAIALGDADGDGDLDVVAGNFAQANRLYLNNGSATPFAAVTGSDVTADVRNTVAIALGDVDGDGDIDLVTGNSGAQTNRLYLNNGTAAPFSAVTGSDVTADAHDTRSIALADLDPDGDLDLVVGNSNQTNRLYRNNGTATPWSGAVGENLGTDTDDTRAIAVGPLHRDGSVEVLVGNSGQSNEWYGDAPGTAVDTARNLGRSLEVDTRSTTIPNATLTATADLPPNTSIDYWLSNDGGAKWRLAKSGQEVAFPSAGIDLRWKAELRTASPALGPKLQQVQILTTDYTAPAVDLLVPDGGEAWAAGSTRNILWSASDDEGLAGFTLEFRNEELPAPAWQPVVCGAPLTGASRSCQWTVPATTSTAMRIRITASDTRPSPGGPNTTTDQSTGTFYVIQPNSDQVRTLVVWNEPRMRSRYAAADVDALEAALLGFVSHVKVDGVLLDLAAVPSLTTAYATWDGTVWNPANQTDSAVDVASANALADAIRNYVFAQVATTFPNLEHLVLVGGDPQIPFFRVADATLRQPESLYVPELQASGFLGGPSNTTFCLGTESPVFAALCQNRYLGDTKYGASTEKPVGGSTQQWFLPDVSVGRLVEKPTQITALLAAYVAQDGVTIVDEALTTGYDFLTDGGDAVNTLLGGALDGGLTTLTRLSQAVSLWDDATLENRLFGNAAPAVPPTDLAFLSGHAAHFAEGAAAAGAAGALTTTEMDDEADNRGGVVVGVGCHSGLAVEPDGNPAYDDVSASFQLDLPELFAKRKIPAFVGNGGYGWGLSDGVGLGEQLVLLIADEIVRAGQIPVGEALRLAKQEYFLRQDRLDAFDHKVLHESMLFGIPNYEIRVHKSASLAAGSWHSSDSGGSLEGRDDARSSGPRVPGRAWLGDPSWTKLDLGRGRVLTKSPVSEVPTATGATLRVLDFQYQAFDAGAGQTWEDAYVRFDLCSDPSGETAACSGPGGAPGSGQTKTGTFFTLDGLASDNPGQPIQPMISFDSKLFGTELHGILMKGGEIVQPAAINPEDPAICTDESGRVNACFDPVVGNPETKADQPEGPAPTPFLSFATPTPFLSFATPTAFLSFATPTPNGFTESTSGGGDPIRFDTLNAPMGETVRRGAVGSGPSRREIVSEWLYRTREFTQLYSSSSDWTAPVVGTATGDCGYAAVWTVSTAYSAGAFIRPTSLNGHVYVAQTSGTSAGSEPAWPVSGTVVDGGVTWKESPYDPFCHSNRIGTTVTFDVPVTDAGDGVYKVFVTYQWDVDASGDGAWTTLELAPNAGGRWGGSIEIPRSTVYLVQAVDWAGNVGTVRVAGNDLDASGAAIGSTYSLPRLYTVILPASALADADGDGMTDTWEDAFGLDRSVNDSALDQDDDLLTNAQEFLRTTSPVEPDSDGDGDGDGSEVAHGHAPTVSGDGHELVIRLAKAGGDVVLDWTPDAANASGPWKVHRAAQWPVTAADFLARLPNGGATAWTDSGGAAPGAGLSLYWVSNVGVDIPVPTVAANSPAGGPRAGGGPVSIYGDGFLAGSAASLGGVPCTTTTWQSANLVTCVAPASPFPIGSGGAADVRVTLPEGRYGVRAKGYSYQP